MGQNNKRHRDSNPRHEAYWGLFSLNSLNQDPVFTASWFLLVQYYHGIGCGGWGGVPRGILQDLTVPERMCFSVLSRGLVRARAESLGDYVAVFKACRIDGRKVGGLTQGWEELPSLSLQDRAIENKEWKSKFEPRKYVFRIPPQKSQVLCLDPTVQYMRTNSVWSIQWLKPRLGAMQSPKARNKGKVKRYK